MRRYETHLHSTTHSKRARAHRGRIAFAISLCASTLPDSPGIGTPRASHPDCQTLDYQSRSSVSPKKTARDRLIAYASPRRDWAIGFLDEVWWSRFALPRMHGWQSQDHPYRLMEQTWQKGDPDPKALACYGVL